MGTASTRRWSWAGHLVPLGLWILSTVLHVGHASYGSVTVKSVIPASAKENVTDTDTLSCVTLTRESTFIEIKFDATVSTLIAYTQHDSDAPGSQGFPVQIRLTHFNENFSFRAGDNMVYVWSGSAGPNQWVKLGLKSQSSTAVRDVIVCEVKAYDVTLSVYCTCDDPCSRNTDNICTATSVCKTPPAGCDTENLALYKSATMSSKYFKSGDASLVVNGNTGTTYSGPGYTNDSTQWNCIHTHPNDTAPYWQVDLGRNYLIERVTIFRRSGESGKERMKGTKVTVDDELCYLVPQIIQSEEKIKLNCKSPINGRNVRISRNRPSGAYGPSMNLCEVQVWGCEAEPGQTQCKDQCGHCNSKHCNESTRKCSQCEDGWYTPRCNVKCGHCLYGKCDQTSGNCTGSCEAGWYSPQCTVGCSSQCENSVCDQNTGHCTNGCEDGWYIRTCDRKCADNCERCDRTTGECLMCKEGWYGSPNCNRCSDSCKNKKCERDSGRCTEGCENGWYLDQCDKSCSSHCQQRNCDQYTGNCKPCKENWAGDRCDGCVPGKYGGQCNQSCGKGCKLTSQVCHPENGQCDCRSGWDPTTIPSCNRECPRKKYGLNCSSTCGQGCGDECNKTTGHCQCEPGWTTELCDRRCGKGLHGANCAKSCSEGCVENSCNDTTGHCDLGCGPGWNHSDPLCDLKCSPGSYGHNCNMTCGYCRGSTECRHDTGHCSAGCAEGFTGDNCHEEITAKEGKEILDNIESVLNDTKTLDWKTADDLMKNLSKVMDADLDVLKEDSIGSRVVSFVERVAQEGALTDGRLTYTAPNLAVAASAVDPNNFTGLTLTASASGDHGFQDGEVTQLPGSMAVAEEHVSSLVLPSSLMTSVNGTRIAMVIYASGKVFEAAKGRQAAKSSCGGSKASDCVTRVNSYVMAASVVGHKVVHLEKPVEIRLAHRNKSSSRPRCVFWNESEADWSTRGCHLVRETSTTARTTCHCNHLTNFALLMDVYGAGGSLSTTHREALSVISHVGCGLSLMSLLLTLITCIFFNPMPPRKASYTGSIGSGHHRWKKDWSNPTKILINLSLALALSNLVFVAGMQEYSLHNQVACKVVAVLLHLFLLSSLCWMAVEAFYMYLALVRIFKTRFTHIILKGFSFAWGVPLVTVVTTLGINQTDNYGSLHTGICWLKGAAFYGAFVAPVCLILLLNIVSFVLVLRVILGLTDNRLDRSDTSRAVQQLRRAVGVVILLGLTWLFGLMAIDKASVVFYYLFAIFNSSQGLFIFLFYCLMNQETRVAWWSCWRRLCNGTSPDMAKGKTVGGVKGDEGQSPILLQAVDTTTDGSGSDPAITVFSSAITESDVRQ